MPQGHSSGFALYDSYAIRNLMRHIDGVISKYLSLAFQDHRLNWQSFRIFDRYQVLISNKRNRNTSFTSFDKVMTPFAAPFRANKPHVKCQICEKNKEAHCS